MTRVLGAACSVLGAPVRGARCVCSVLVLSAGCLCSVLGGRCPVQAPKVRQGGRRGHLTFFFVALLLIASLLTPVGAQRQRRPERIVSLVPSVTEILFAIGAGPAVVGVSSYDHEPPAVERLPRLGALLDPDLERLLALRPDLAVIYGSQAELDAQLRRAGIQVFPYRHGGIADLLSAIRDVGTAAGHQSEALGLVSTLQQRLDAVRGRVASKPRPRVLLVFGRDPLSLRGIYASGGVGFLHDLLEIAGGRDVLGDIQREAVQASTEQILARQPDVILEVRADPMARGMMAREQAAWAPLASVPAVRNNRILFLTGTEMVVPGPRIVEAAERMARALHPDVQQ